MVLSSPFPCFLPSLIFRPWVTMVHNPGPLSIFLKRMKFCDHCYIGGFGHQHLSFVLPVSENPSQPFSALLPQGASSFPLCILQIESCPDLCFQGEEHNWSNFNFVFIWVFISFLLSKKKIIVFMYVCASRPCSVPVEA